VINSKEFNAGNAKSTVEMSTLCKNVRCSRLYEKSKMDAALQNAVNDHDGAVILAQSTKAEKS